MQQPYAIELKGITKTFGSVVANHDVSLNVRQGEILALLGENGSGKTTLMNMLSGIYKPDSGQIFVDGKEVSIDSPEDAKRLGIGMVHQHFKLVDVFSAADNIWMGKEKPGFRLKRDRYAQIADMAQKFGFEIDPKKKVYNMAVSEKQTLEIIKVLYYGAKVIILDEPTAVLTVQEIDKLFSVLRRMKDEGHSIIIITHKLNEVMDISDRVAILRKGAYITTVNTAETNEQALTEWMVGHKVDLNIDRPAMEKTRPLLEVRDLTIRSDEGATAIDGVNFYIRGGEILGVAGIAGCGQKELCEAIAGLRPIVKGQMIHKGENIVGLPPKTILEKGISMSFIPEDRLGMGLAPSLSITDNMLLKNYADSKGPFVDRRTGRADAERDRIICDRVAVRLLTQSLWLDGFAFCRDAYNVARKLADLGLLALADKLENIPHVLRVYILALGRKCEQAVYRFLSKHDVLFLAAYVYHVVPVKHLDAEFGLYYAQVLVKRAENTYHMLHSVYFYCLFYHQYFLSRRSRVSR